MFFSKCNEENLKRIQEWIAKSKVGTKSIVVLFVSLTTSIFYSLSTAISLSSGRAVLGVVNLVTLDTYVFYVGTRSILTKLFRLFILRTGNKSIDSHLNSYALESFAIVILHQVNPIGKTEAQITDELKENKKWWINHLKPRYNKLFIPPQSKSMAKRGIWKPGFKRGSF